MKPKEDNLETNISRLVKLAGDSDRPSQAFANSVVENTLEELKTPGSKRTRKAMGKSAKAKWLKIFAYAASIIIVSGVVVVLTISEFGGARDEMKVSWAQVLKKIELVDDVLSEPGMRNYPMAHGGTTPPNGEDIDAMFFKNYGVNPFGPSAA
ncbi:MAG: hypothetical protein ACYS91_19460 [Planctomycetota bacterium]|jgi:hypothetical protein